MTVASQSISDLLAQVLEAIFCHHSMNLFLSHRVFNLLSNFHFANRAIMLGHNPRGFG